MDIHANLAENLVKYRKSLGLTQAQLAEKLNYSDKAVSKWERAEAVPELSVLKQIADIFGVTIDVLISEPKSPIVKPKHNIAKKRLIIAIIATFFVWLVATLCFAFINVISSWFNGKVFEQTWLSFMYAIPVTLVILLILTSVWGKNFWNMIFTSLLCWTTILAIYLTLIFAIVDAPETLWMVFLAGIPTQALIILFFFYKKVK